MKDDLKARIANLEEKYAEAAIEIEDLQKRKEDLCNETRTAAQLFSRSIHRLEIKRHNRLVEIHKLSRSANKQEKDLKSDA